MVTSIIAFVIVLGVLIFFHELGHFLIARMNGVGVEIFSLGFGPRITGKKIGRTDYRLSALPLGGFVKMVGEEPDAEIPEEDIPLSFTHKSVYRRISIVAAGPFFNLVLAWLIFFAMFQITGIYIMEPVVGSIREDSPAAVSGIQAGDRIMAINGVEIHTWEDMSDRISQSKGQSLDLTVSRGNEIIPMTIAPQMTLLKNIFGEDIERYVIGVTSAGKYHTQNLSPPEAVLQSFVQTYRVTKLTVIGIYKLIAGTLSTKTLGGPIMIAQMAGDQAREGASNLIYFIALLSVNLAVLNFLPIPVLDGGHLMFFCIEAVMRKPVNTRVREIAQQAGIFVLLMLMIFAFYNDIARIFTAS
jgi:regulator of sigma E protease